MIQSVPPTPVDQGKTVGRVDVLLVRDIASDLDFGKMLRRIRWDQYKVPNMLFLHEFFLRLRDVLEGKCLGK